MNRILFVIEYIYPYFFFFWKGLEDTPIDVVAGDVCDSGEDDCIDMELDDGCSVDSIEGSDFSITDNEGYCFDTV